MKVVDGKNAILGRLATYVAKEALKGEEVAVVNVEEIMISGNKRDIKERIEQKRRRVGSSQKGPKVSRSPEKFVKRVIRGMLPNHRTGRGKEAFKRIRCYVGVPEKFKEVEKISLKHKSPIKFVKIKEILK